MGTGRGSYGVQFELKYFSRGLEFEHHQKVDNPVMITIVKEGGF